MYPFQQMAQSLVPLHPRLLHEQDVPLIMFVPIQRTVKVQLMEMRYRLRLQRHVHQRRF